ncbi:protein TANC2 isoform X3 [Lepeophtheirus salmonis]|uniref:protein TANC2 isoform X3 n=1 Tax=Lepeophtheirus salmonis TaxID=72036 RepID=UPI001AEAAA03|nr:protein TANC2-like isoform X3 [Lepeophtheirus salmonis]
MNESQETPDATYYNVSAHMKKSLEHIYETIPESESRNLDGSKQNENAGSNQNWILPEPDEMGLSYPFSSNVVNRDKCDTISYRNKSQRDPRGLNLINQNVCPTCGCPFDLGKKRRVIDSCGHERCFSCLYAHEVCSLCTGRPPPPTPLPPDLTSPENMLSGHMNNSRAVSNSSINSFYPLPYNNTPNLFDTPSSQIHSNNSTLDSFRSADCSPLRRSSRGLPSPARSCHEFPPNGYRNSTISASFRSRPASPAFSHALPPISQNARVSATPPPRRSRFFASPKPSRPSWMQRHGKRPQTVNIDDNTLSDDTGSITTRGVGGSTSSTNSGLVSRRSSSGISPNPFIRSSLRASSVTPSSHNFESSSGIRSSPSFGTLPKQHHKPPVSCYSASSNASTCSFVEGSTPPSEGLRSFADSGVVVMMDQRSNDSSSNGDLTGSRSSLAGSSSHRSGSFVPYELQQIQYCQKSKEQWTLKPLYFEIPQREPNPAFIGRQWLYSEVIDHLNSELPTNRGVIITGAPGTGKTSIILKMVEHSCFGRSEPIYNDSAFNSGQNTYRKQPMNAMKRLSSMVVAYQFCQTENRNTCTVPEFVHSLAAQLAQSPQLRFYNNYLSLNSDIRAKLSPGECLSDPDTSFVQGILEPLRYVHGEMMAMQGGAIKGQTCIILIDGLCDSEFQKTDYGDTIGSFLIKHLEALPPWLKIVCTVRSDMTGCTRGLPFHQINLDKCDVDERVRKDMMDYISYRISNSQEITANVTPSLKSPSKDSSDGTPIQRFTDYLMELTSGCFLFAKLTLDLVERGNLVIKSSSFKVLPVSLSEIFLLEFNLKFPSSQSFASIADILSVCLTSRYPMNLDEIYSCVTSLLVNEVLPWPEFVNQFNMLSGYLIRRGDESIMFYHPLFREWLLYRSVDDHSTKFLCDPRVGHIGIGLNLIRREGQFEPETLLEIAYHMLEAHVCDDPSEDNTSLAGAASRELQACWLAQPAETISHALASLKNIFSPDAKVSRLLLLSGASPHFLVQNYLKKAPLIGVYAHEGFEEMVGLLLEYRADVNSANAMGVTPLMFASMKGYLDIVRFLLESGATVNKTDRNDRCALVYAAQHGHLAVIEVLIEYDWDNDHDLTLAEAAQQAMVMAASRGRTQALEFFLNMAEVRVNFHETLNGETGLCAAASAGQQECCEILIRRGGCALTANLSGSPPLHVAIKNGHWNVTDFLLREGAHIEQVDSTGKSPLIIACMEGHLGLVELFVSRGADMTRADRDGITCIGWACLKGQCEAVSYLIDQGCDISVADNTGRTPLDLASFKGNSEIVTLLLEKGASMEHTDINGMRPLDRAISCRNASVVQCFLKKGARLGPATWTLANGKPEIMLLLLNKLLEDGNTLFRKEKLQDAAHRYQYALRRIPNICLPTVSSISDPKLRKTFEQLNVHLLLNLTRCRRKTGHFREAIDLADKVLKINPGSFEAYYAKAKANRESGNLHSALADLTEAVRIAPSNRDIHRIILRVKEEICRAANPNRKNNSDSNNKALKELNNNNSTTAIDNSASNAEEDPEQTEEELIDIDEKENISESRKDSSSVGDNMLTEKEKEADSTSGVDSSTGSSSTKDFDSSLII